MSEGYHENVVVASIDIEGMKNLICRDDKLESANIVLSQLMANIASNQIQPDSKGKEVKFWHHQFLGDSIYLIGNPKMPVELQLDYLSMATGIITMFGLFGDAIIGDTHWLLKIGIGIGDMSLIEWNLGQYTGNVFIGKSMISAFNLERNQDWFGIAISPDLDGYSKTNTNILEYKIPMKDGETLSNYSVNWISFLRGAKEKLKIKDELTADFVSKRIMNISADIGYQETEKEKVAAKIENTTKYIEYLFNSF